MTLGLGRAALVRIPTNDRFEMDARTRSPRAIAADRAAGHRPIAIVATVGTTSSTSVDPSRRSPTSPSAKACGSMSMPRTPVPSRSIPDRRAPFAGWERADSIVVNPHKWLLTPVDASLLLTRRLELVRDAFSLVPEYLRTRRRQPAPSATTTSTRRSSGGGCGP